MEATNEQLTLEQAVLGSVILENNKQEQIEKIDAISEELFIQEYNRLILRTIKEVKEQGLYVDVVTIRTQNDTIDIKYLTDLTTYATTSSFESYVLKLKESAEKRNVKNILAEATAGISEGKDIEYILNKITKNISDFEKNRIKDTISPSAKMDAAFNRLIDLIESQIEYPKWGIDVLDKYTIGIKPGETTVIAGASGLGKTAIVCQILLKIFYQNKKVLFFNLEMNIESVLARLFSHAFAVPVDYILSGNFENTEAWSNIFSLYSLLVKDNNFIIMDDVRNIEDMKRYIKQEKPDIVAIDYLQLCTSNEEYYNREQEVAAISRECKEMSKQFNCHIIQLSQVNAEVLDHRPKGEKGLRESKAIYHAVDNCIYLWEPTKQYFGEYENRTFSLGVEEVWRSFEEYEQWKNKKGVKLVEVILDKQRQGKTGRGQCLFEGSSNRYLKVHFDDKKDIPENSNIKAKSNTKAKKHNL